jgi:hypothetical protein
MLFRLYTILISAQEAARRGTWRALDALARALGWGANWEEGRVRLWQRAVPWLAWVAVMATGYLLARHALLPWLYEWQARRFVAQAEQCARAGQPAAAAFRLRKALALQPQHAGATRLIARLSEEADSPTALVWYWRLAGTPEVTTADRLGLARTALRFERPPFLLASNGLFAIALAERRHPAHAMLLAEYYLKTGRPQLAEKQYELAWRLAPTNLAAQMALHTVRLASTNTLLAQQAAQWLGGMAEHPVHGLSACRSLREYYLGENQPAPALAWAERALAHPQAQFQDTLRHLEALRLATPEAVAPRLRAVWPAAVSRPAQWAALLEWLLGSNQAGLAWELWQTLPAPLQLPPELRPVAVSVYVQTGRRQELGEWLQRQHWGQEDWRRRMLLIRTWREAEKQPEATQAWEELLNLAQERPAWLYETARLAQQWQWRETFPILLERALPRLCRDTDEVLRWHGLLEPQGQTLLLWQMYQQLLTCQTNWLTLNNYAALSLLLGREVPAAHALARRLYEERPQNEFCAATYAFSLHLQGQSSQGLKVLERLPRRALERPVVMAYHGVLLAATGRKEAALNTLEKAAQAPLLPEERALLDQARATAQALPWPERRPTPPARKP